MNTWTVSGAVIAQGIKGKKYPTLWVNIELPVPKQLQMGKNNVFVNFSLDTNLSSSNGKVGEYVKNTLDSTKFVCVSEAIVSELPFSKRGDDGEWKTIHKPGLKAGIKKIDILNERPPDINIGLVKGKVVEQTGEKVFIEDRYRIPSTGEWKSRKIPLLLLGADQLALVGKLVFVQAHICGATPSGVSKTFGVSDNYVVLT